LLAAQFSIPATYNDYKKMLDEIRPDAVFSLVTPSESKSIIKECLERGVPCLSEKPAGINFEEALELATVAENTKTLGMAGLNWRHASTVREAIRVIRSKGPIYGISATYALPLRNDREKDLLDPKVAERGMTLFGIHIVDLLTHIGGDVKSVHAIKSSIEQQGGDNFCATLQFQTGVVGSFRSHWLSGQRRRMGFEIHGDGISADFRQLEKGEILQRTSRKPTPLRFAPEDILFTPGIYRQTFNFLNAVANATIPDSPALLIQDAPKTMKLAEQLSTEALQTNI